MAHDYSMQIEFIKKLPTKRIEWALKYAGTPGGQVHIRRRLKRKLKKRFLLDELATRINCDREFLDIMYYIVEGK